MCVTKIRTNMRFGLVCNQLVIRQCLWSPWVSKCGSSVSALFPLALLLCLLCMVCCASIWHGVYGEASQQCGPLANHRLAHKDWSHGPHITCHLGPTDPSGSRRPRWPQKMRLSSCWKIWLFWCLSHLYLGSPPWMSGCNWVYWFSSFSVMAPSAPSHNVTILHCTL